MTSMTTHSERRDAHSLPSYDLYGLVHKGLRGELCALLTRMAALAPGDHKGLQVILDDLQGVLYMCTSHGSHEDRHYHTALEARRAGASDFLNDTHAQLEADIGALQDLSAQLAAAPDAGDPGLLRSLYLRYSAFVGRNLMHMAEEEERAQRLFEQLYSAAELPGIHANLLRAIGPEEKLASLRAMLLAVNPQERLQLLDVAQVQLPARAWSELLTTLRRCLPAAELQAIAGRYSERPA
jgi:hypothetical protein